MKKAKIKAKRMNSPFNPDQLTTIEEARTIASKITFCNGIAAEDSSDDYHNTTSGIYLDPWQNPTGQTPEPQIGDARPFLFRFNPTGDFQPAGFNVGLIRQLAINHAPPVDDGQPPNPPNWDYALSSFWSEVDAQITNAKNG